MSESAIIGGYYVLATLGHGAGSTIYKVQDDANHCYALKHVTKRDKKDERFIAQAVSEHEVAQQFYHRTLRRSHRLFREGAFGRTTGVLVVMELVEGQTLLERRPSSILKAVKLFRRIARGLAHMHDAGFVHADIKPSNILLTKDNQPKLIDFGQSCPIGTVKQRIQGTPDYIAPEQVRRQALTARTDIYNLGATMYWLLTQRHPPSPLRVRGGVGTQRSATGEPVQPPNILNPEVPAALSSLVMACIERGVASRPTSMQDVISRLELANEQAQRSSRNIQRRRS